jgi:hypothetical protein
MEATIISTIAVATVSLLVSYMKSIGEGFAKKTGEELGKQAGGNAWHKAKQLYQVTKAKFSTKSETREVMDALEKSPSDDDTQAVMRFHLKGIMASDENFAKELAYLLKEASEAGADTVFQTTILGDVQKLVQMGNVYGNVNI